MVVRIFLTVTDRAGASREEVVNGDSVTLGRAQAHNDVVLPKGNISKHHTRILFREGKLIVVDLRSTNGTWVNGKRVQAPLVLKDGDKIYIGDFTITARVQLDGRPASQGVPAAPPRPSPLPSPLPEAERARTPPAGTPAAQLEVARAIAGALTHGLTREIVLHEGEPIRAQPPSAELARLVPSREVLIAVVRACGVDVSAERPVFDGPARNWPAWRVTVLMLDGAPAKARFARKPALSIDDDIDPIPPG